MTPEQKLALESTYQEVSLGEGVPEMAWLNGVCYYIGADGKPHYEGSEEQHKKNLEILKKQQETLDNE